MIAALAVFRELPVPDGDFFSVASHPAHSELLIGKDASGAPAVICTIPIAVGAMPVRLRNVILLPQAIIEIRHGERRNTITATIYQCRATSGPLREYFVVAVTSILGTLLTAERFEAGGILQQLAELFHHLETAPRSTVQGLWGELFVIAEASRPVVLLEAWHNDSYEQFDFANAFDRLEVKTCASPARKHHFSLSQARPAPPIRAVIASVVCTRSTGGMSLRELVQRVRQLATDPGHAIKLETLIVEALGEALLESLDVRFDREVARDSLRFFPTDRVPSISPVLPDGVTNVHFEATLPIALALTHTESGEHNSLLAAAWPSPENSRQ